MPRSICPHALWPHPILSFSRYHQQSDRFPEGEGGLERGLGLPRCASLGVIVTAALIRGEGQSVASAQGGVHYVNGRDSSAIDSLGKGAFVDNFLLLPGIGGVPHLA